MKQVQGRVQGDRIGQIENLIWIRVNPKRKGGDGKGIPIFKRILFKIEGGDYEGVQSFSKRG
jgi:hypothetical protein